MLHHDVLIRLCNAREMLRDPELGELRVPQIARRSGISTFHFIRLFKAVFGETPQQCRIAAQLEKARHLLTVTDRSVTDICLEVGFTSLGTFSDLFSRRIGLSPSAYQKKIRGMQQSPREIPRDLIPGCFCLMGKFPVTSAISKK